MSVSVESRSSCLRVDEVTEEAFCVSLKHTWYIIMCIQNDVDLVHLLDGMAAQVSQNIRQNILQYLSYANHNPCSKICTI